MATQGGGFGEGAMDQALLQRYLLLFLGYDLGGNEVIEHIKGRIAEHMAGGAQLRPDAAHLLLVLADQMILRPYSSPITPIVDGVLDRPPPQTAAEIREKLDQTFDGILEQLDRTNAPRPRSAHSILKAMEEQWPKIATVFRWA